MGSDIDEKILKDIREQICPLFEDKNTLIEIMLSQKVEKTLDSITKNNSLLKTLLHRLKTKKENAFLSAVLYLFEVETSSNLIFDILIILLSAKGQIFHIEPDNKNFFIRHAVTIEDLETSSVTLGRKLNFLKRNNLDCLQKYAKNKLRDKIAHIDYEIDDNGCFFINDNNKKKPVDIKSEFIKLSTFNTQVIHQITKALQST